MCSKRAALDRELRRSFVGLVGLGKAERGGAVAFNLNPATLCQQRIMAPNPLILLLVEDDDNDVYLFNKAVRQLGLEVQVQAVTTARAAMDYLLGQGAYADRQQYPAPGLVVLDLTLPGSSGLELLQWCASNEVCKALPRVVMSGLRHGDALLETAVAHGAGRAFVKSMEFEELKQTVQQIYDFVLSQRSAL